MDQQLQVLLSHESVEWYTPEKYASLARKVFGGFIHLDPASCWLANTIIKAENYYTIDDNALGLQWNALNVWLNPPYGKTGQKSNQEIWADKLIEEYKAGRVGEAILLVKASVGYNWFTKIRKQADARCLSDELIPFIKPEQLIDGVEWKNRAKLGSAFFYFGEKIDKFKEVFSEIGEVV